MYNLPFHRKPVIICGAHGGGTSYITKMLRFCGFFAGNDAGNILSRKYHESLIFNQINREIGQTCGDEHLMTSESLVLADSEMNHNLEFWVSFTIANMEKITENYLAPDKEISWVPKTWLMYNFGSRFKNKIWGWPGYVLFLHRKWHKQQPWGWKDPRNSITLPLWKKLFPDAKILVIVKNKSSKPSTSTSGKWFSEKATLENLEVYQKPSALFLFENVFFANFENIVQSHEAFNQLLSWIELKNLTSREFRYLKYITNFENN